MYEKIIIGTAQFGLDYGISNTSGRTPLAEIKNIIDYASCNSLTMYDTAQNYGECENILGKLLPTSSQLITKIIVHTSDNPLFPQLFSSISTSLSRLRCQSFYAVLIHNPKDLYLYSSNEINSAFNRLKELGLCSKIGLSCYFEDLYTFLNNPLDIDILQFPFNIFDRRLATAGVLCELNSRGIELHSRSVFLQGLLLMDPSTIPYQLSACRQQLISYRKYCSQSGISILDLCLSYVLHNSFIDRTIVGINNSKHLAEIIKSASSMSSLSSIPHFPIHDQFLLSPHKWFL